MYYRMECKRYNNQEATTNHCVAKDIKLLFTNQHFNCQTSEKSLSWFDTQ